MIGDWSPLAESPAPVRFYAAPLMGEMAIAELQSKRRPRPWER